MWNQIKEYAIYFIVGGAVTALIVGLEKSGSRLMSGFATLVPVFTLVAYIFIGESRGGAAVGQHAWLVLIGTLVAWVPYMLVVAFLAPKIGSTKAIPAALAVFTVLAISYIETARYFKWFE